MANTSARMLRLLSLLQTHRYWPGSELADRLEVSPRTLRRDVDRLRDLGYPVDASRGVAGGYQLQAGAAVPPLLLDDDEAVAIAVGLRTSAAGAVAGFEEISVRALAKVIQLLPPRLRRQIDALRVATTPGVFGGGPTLDATALTTIALACRGEERLRFRYAPRERDAALRHVEPHRLVPLGSRWYLIAWDLDRADWRSFRVDRLTAPSSTGTRFRPRDLPGGDPVAWLRARIAGIATRYEVSIVLETDPDQVRGVVGHWGTVEPLTDDEPGATAPRAPASASVPPTADAGRTSPHAAADAGRTGSAAAERTPPATDAADAAHSAGPAVPAGPRTPAGTRQACRLRMSVDDLGWPVMVLGVLGAPFTIESPPELRERVRAAGETLLRGAA